MLEVERKVIGEDSSEVAPLRRASSDSGSDKNTTPRKGRSAPFLIVSQSFRSSEDRELLVSIATKVTDLGVTALMLACRLDDLGDAYMCVRALLIAKANPASQTKNNKVTALHVAAESAPLAVELQTWSG